MYPMLTQLVTEIIAIGCFTFIFACVVLECYYVVATWGGWYKHIPLQVRKNWEKKFRERRLHK